MDIVIRRVDVAAELCCRGFGMLTDMGGSRKGRIVNLRYALDKYTGCVYLEGYTNEGVPHEHRCP